jgi:bifunctional DNase/RNase
MPSFLELRLDSISVTNAGFIVFLKGENETRVLPIFIGANEAQAIALALGEEPPPRPMTHDLLKSMLDSLDAIVTRVDIIDIKDGTFYAKVHMSRGDLEEHEFDARPSDAIALAVRYDAPIFATRAVFEDAAIKVIVKPTDESDEAEDEEGPEALEIAEGDAGYDVETDPEFAQARETKHITPEIHSLPLTPLEKLQADLNAAVKDERYEEAARIRDVLKRMGVGN